MKNEKHLKSIMTDLELYLEQPSKKSALMHARDLIKHQFLREDRNTPKKLRFALKSILDSVARLEVKYNQDKKAGCPFCREYGWCSNCPAYNECSQLSKHYSEETSYVEFHRLRIKYAIDFIDRIFDIERKEEEVK